MNVSSGRLSSRRWTVLTLRWYEARVDLLRSSEWSRETVRLSMSSHLLRCRSVRRSTGSVLTSWLTHWAVWGNVTSTHHWLLISLLVVLLLMSLLLVRNLLLLGHLLLHHLLLSHLLLRHLLLVRHGSLLLLTLADRMLDCLAVHSLLHLLLFSFPGLDSTN